MIGTTLPGGSAFGGNCVVNYVVTDAGDSKGVHGKPIFQTDGYRIAPNVPDNIACCVDKISAAADLGMIFVDHDIDGTTRPIGAGYDVGPAEVQ